LDVPALFRFGKNKGIIAMAKKRPPTFNAAKLTEARTAAELSRTELAEKVNISRQMLRYLEIGQNEPTFSVACRLADALGLTLEDLRG
jgi:transcriptional regulator with XRE-family HTH domain